MFCLQCAAPSDLRCSRCKVPFCSALCSNKAWARHKIVCGRIFAGDIERMTLENDEFGPVIIYEDPAGHDQLGLMALRRNQRVPRERHADLTQFVRVELGEARVIVDGDEFVLRAGGATVIPAGSWHEIVNVGDGWLKFYTIYSKDTSKKWEH